MNDASGKYYFLFVVYIPITIGEIKYGICKRRNVSKTIFIVYALKLKQNAPFFNALYFGDF